MEPSSSSSSKSYQPSGAVLAFVSLDRLMKFAHSQQDDHFSANLNDITPSTSTSSSENFQDISAITSVFSLKLTIFRQRISPIVIGDRAFELTCDPTLTWLLRQYSPVYTLALLVAVMVLAGWVLLRYHFSVVHQQIQVLQQRDQFLQYLSHEIKNPLQVCHCS
jgi:signal transduction histidine kinase